MRLSRTIAIVAAAALCLASCKIKNASEEAKLQARYADGDYTVTGTIELGAYNDEEGKTLDFSGKGTATNLGNAVLNISYVSDSTGETKSIIADIEEDGTLLFRNFSVNYEGIPFSTTMHQSSIRRYGSDTIAGKASCTMTIFGMVSRDALFEVTAIRIKD